MAKCVVLMFFEASLMSCVLDNSRTWGCVPRWLRWWPSSTRASLSHPWFKRNSVYFNLGRIAADIFPGCFLIELTEEIRWLWLYAPENVLVTVISYMKIHLVLLVDIGFIPCLKTFKGEAHNINSNTGECIGNTEFYS